jgi:hypothetical protein
MSRSCISYIVKWIGPSDGLSYLKHIPYAQMMLGLKNVFIFILKVPSYSENKLAYIRYFFR